MILEPKDLGLGSTANDNSSLSEAVDLSGTLSDVVHRALRVVEKKKIAAGLASNNGNKSKTAEDLGISYKTLLTKVKEYDL